MLSKAGWTPFDGRTVRGRVVLTFLRGTPVAEEGRPLDERTGRFLPGRGATRRLILAFACPGTPIVRMQQRSLCIRLRFPTLQERT